MDTTVWGPRPQLWCVEKLKIAPCWSRFNCPGTLSRYRAEGAGAGGGGRKACIMTMHGLSCKELQGRKKAPHSFFSRNHTQDADSVHDKPSSGKESPCMNPGSGKQGRFILRFSSQMSIPWGSALDSTLEKGVSTISRDSLSNWRASPIDCLYLTPHGDFLPHSRDSGMNGDSEQETVRMYGGYSPHKLLGKAWLSCIWD